MKNINFLFFMQLFRLRSHWLLIAGLFCMSALPTNVYAQAFELSGVVTNARGEGIAGATVILEGTAIGAYTDEAGAYRLSVKDGSGRYTVLFRFIGYATQRLPITVTVGGTATLNATLVEDYIGLEEVVVTGTSAATTKKQLGNAISTIDASAISQSGAQGIDQALSGKLSGALVNQNSGNPAGGISITLRGNSTVFGSSDPLYIIDGVIVDNSSPELVDLGGYAQNRLVDINPNDIERVEVIKGAAAAAIYGSRASNGVVQIFTKKGIAGKPSITFSSSIKSSTLRKEIEENMEPFKYDNPNDPINTDLVPTERFQMQDYIFSPGMGTENYLSVRGGSDRTRYFLSGSYNLNEGIIDNTQFDRYTSRANVDQIFNDWLSASVGLSYTYSTSQEVPNGGLGEFYGALTGFNFNNNNFDPEPDQDGNYSSPAGFVANPLEAIETYDFGQSASRFIGSIGLNANPFKGFGIQYRLGFDTYTQTADGYIPVGSNQQGTGWARGAVATSLLMNNDLDFTYSAEVVSGIQSNSRLGFTVQYDRTRRITQTANNLSPVVNTTDGGTIISRGDTRAERAIQGAFFQQTFGLWDKLFVTGAIRLDAASTFGEDERTQYYPKGSFSYVLSEEEFWKSSLGNAISTFKVRASYGESGNLSALAAYERLSNYNPAPINGQTGLVPSTRLGNPTLRPERQKEVEIGLDVGLLNNRIGLELTYYDVEVEDLLLTRTLANSTGFSTRLENVGTMTNQGFEALVRAVPVQNETFSWNVIATFSTNKNEVNGIEGEQLALPKSFGVSLARNGEPIGVLDGFYYAREANGEIALDANGLPSRATDSEGNIDRKTIGDPNPDWLGSLINEFTYKNLAFRVQFDAVQGFDIFNFTDRVNSRSRFGGGFRDAQEIRGDLPRGFNNASYNIWERYIEDGSFIKLRELSLNYTIRPNSGGLNAIVLGVIGRNLLSFDDYNGWDPETSAAGQQNGVRGFDFNEVPIPRTIMFQATLQL